MSDIEFLQLPFNENVFKHGVRLFCKKWQKTEGEFFKYFMDNWIKRNHQWFEGYGIRIPSTNNCLESFNNQIKKHQTFRHRLSLTEFKVVVLEMVQEWSQEYINEQKVFAIDIPINMDVWRKGYDFAKSSRQILVKEGDGFSKYFLYSSENEEKDPINQAAVDKYLKMQWNSFDVFKINLHLMWIVTMTPTENEWLKATCTCQIFLKKFMCKHISGIAIRLKLAKPPAQLKDRTKKTTWPTT